jgi:hypothetical protein
MAERLMALSKIEGLVEENAESWPRDADTWLKRPTGELWN